MPTPEEEVQHNERVEAAREAADQAWAEYEAMANKADSVAQECEGEANAEGGAESTNE